MGGVSIAQSNKHNKHFQELIILQESLQRFKLVAVEISKLPVASAYRSPVFLFPFETFWNKLKFVLQSVKWGFKILFGELLGEKNKKKIETKKRIYANLSEA